jgi:hypothetical protein
MVGQLLSVPQAEEQAAQQRTIFCAYLGIDTNHLSLHLTSTTRWLCHFPRDVLLSRCLRLRLRHDGTVVFITATCVVLQPVPM